MKANEMKNATFQYVVKEGTDEDGSPLGENLFAVMAPHMSEDEVLWFDEHTANRVCAELNKALGM